MSQTTVSSPLVERRDAARALKDRIGWSWQKLAERMDLNPSQGNALSLAKRLISEQDLAWMEALAAAIEAHPRPAPVAEVRTITQPLATTGMEQFILVESVPVDAVAESRGRSRARIEAAEAIAEQYDALNGSALTPEQRAGARAVLSNLAAAMGLLPEVRMAIDARKDAAPRTQPEPPPRVEPPAAAWTPPGIERDLGERGRQPF